MTMKNIFVILSLAVLVMSCGGTGNGRTGNGAAADSDTVASRVQTVEELFLPDTSYASVKNLEWHAEYSDTLPQTLEYVGDIYEKAGGVRTFRKNLMRNAAFGGRVKGTPTTVETAWTFDTKYDSRPTKYGTWGGGTGWTGQPLYVKWTPADMGMFGKNAPAPLPGFTGEEIMVGSLCGNVYFIDFNTGKPSRQPYVSGNVIKGTMSLDPELKNLYAGQGVPHGEPFGNFVFDLLRHERTFFFARDPKAPRGWNAFDSSPIVAGGYLFWAGENGSVYKFRREQGRLILAAVARYRADGMAPGIESSLCVYRNYGFFSDNRGNIICLNLNTMKPVWHCKNLDDSDGTPVCSVENGTPYIYTACEVDKQGDEGFCRFLKLNALDGSVVWEQLIRCTRFLLPGKTLDGGMYATPLLGSGDCKGMIFANICRNKAGKKLGELTALSTSGGKILYTVPLDYFAWSSPVALHNEKGEMYIFTGDASGSIYLVRGKTGEVIFKKHVANNFESSPVVVENSVVVGSRGTTIYKFTVK